MWPRLIQTLLGLFLFLSLTVFQSGEMLSLIAPLSKLLLTLLSVAGY